MIMMVEECDCDGNKIILAKLNYEGSMIRIVILFLS